MRVGLVTSAALPELHEDERPLREALSSRGITGVPVVWGPQALEAEVDGYLMRNPWDWYLRATEFATFLAALPEVCTWNAPSLMRSCLGKDYLLALANAGVPIVPTELVDGNGADVRRAIRRRGWTRAVVKPLVSAGAHRTVRVPDDDIEALPRDRWLVQPYLDRIEEGELSFIFIERRLSHVVRKRPAAGDFRVQEEHGGSAAREPIDPALASQASAALHALGGEPLYARVDGVVDDGVLRVMEIEVVEPQLFFTLCPEAGERLAEALSRRLARLDPSGPRRRSR